MKNFLWKVALCAVVFIFFWASKELLARWMLTPRRIAVVIVIVVLVFFFRLLTPYLERMYSIIFFSGVVLIFIASRLWWLDTVPTIQVSDFQYYYHIACGVAAGKGITSNAVSLTNGLGYPLLLGLIFRFFGCSLGVGKAVNVILGLATIPALYSLARRFGGKAVGRWVVVFFVLWPNQLMYTGLMATEHLGFLLGVWGLVFGVRLLDREGNRWANTALCGLLLTLGTFVRPAILVLLAAVGLALLLQNHPLKARLSLAAFLALTFLVVNSGYNLALKTFNYGVTPSPTFSTAAALFYGLNFDSGGGWTQEDSNIIYSWPRDQALKLSLEMTWQRVSSHTPGQILRLLQYKNYIFWGAPRDGYEWSTNQLESTQGIEWLKSARVFACLYSFQFFLLFGAIVTAIGLLGARGSAKVATLLLVLILGTFLHLIFAISPRYDYVYMFGVFILASIGLSWKTWRNPALGSLKIENTSLEAYNRQRIQHWDNIAENMKRWQPWNRYYHRRLTEIYQFLTPAGLRVLEVGCGQGDLLAALKPSYGAGIDFSGKMIAAAKEKHPQLHFLQADAHQLDLDETFDVIILSDLVDDAWDVEKILKQIHKLCTPRTRLIINYYSRIWAPVFAIVEQRGLATPKLPQNWLVVEDVTNLLYLANFEVLKHQREILWPFAFRPLDVFFNRFLVKIWPFSLFALTNLTIAKPAPQPTPPDKAPTVSIVVPARNESGNIPNIFQRTPELGSRTELIFVEGHSKDNTYQVIEEMMSTSARPCQLLKQIGKGKGDAVRQGFTQANGDVLMILDADLTVPPEDLPKFYEALLAGKGEMINGVRLVYPMDKEAMQFFNFLGNKFFSLAFSWLLGQPIKDTLCGTKALWRKDYELIAANRAYFGDFDPFGDYDLLFGAAKLNRKIVDLPIRYRERTYGTTNIQRWKHGWLLLRMVAFAALRIKFV